jgi:hypothetical protein
MLRFLFGAKPAAAAKPETQREAFTRLLEDLNTAIAALPEKPKVIVDPQTGRLDLELPERLPDETLALPSPGPEGGSGTSAATDAPAEGEKPAGEGEQTPGPKG